MEPVWLVLLVFPVIFIMLFEQHVRLKIGPGWWKCWHRWVSLDAFGEPQLSLFFHRDEDHICQKCGLEYFGKNNLAPMKAKFKKEQ